MLEEYDFRKLNELSVGIQTDAIRIHVEWLHVVRSNSFYNPKWHTHPIAELHCVLEGTDVFYMGGNHALSVNSGLCLLIPPNAEHRRVSEPNDKLVKFSICLGSELLKGSDEAKFLDSFLHLSVFQLMPFPADAQDMMRVYPIRLHTDWVLLGAFLHDVSKIAEYRQDETGAYVRTAAGVLYQHAFLGAHYALQAGLPPEVVSIIQCHTPQSNVKMKLLEGVIVQHAEAGIAASGIDYAGQMREALH